MTEDNRSDLGKILKQRRVMIPLTILELAHIAGVSPSHLGRIEKGERFPSAHILRRLAKPLGYEEAELLTFGGYLSSQPSSEAEGRIGPDPKRLDPYVAMVLSQEPVEVQRTVIGILSILKSIARRQDAKRGHDVSDVSG